MRGNTVGWDEIELVVGAIIYDFGRRENAGYPDADLGRAALQAAREGLLPRCSGRGACSATVGKTFAYEEGEASGQGGALPPHRKRRGSRCSRWRRVRSSLSTAAAPSRAVIAIRNAARRRHPVDALESCLPRAGSRKHDADRGDHERPAGSVLSLFSPPFRSRLARQGDRTLPRAVDGDVLCAVTTNEVENEELTATSLGSRRLRTRVGRRAGELAYVTAARKPRFLRVCQRVRSFALSRAPSAIETRAIVACVRRLDDVHEVERPECGPLVEHLGAELLDVLITSRSGPGSTSASGRPRGQARQHDVDGHRASFVVVSRSNRAFWTKRRC